MCADGEVYGTWKVGVGDQDGAEVGVRKSCSERERSEEENDGGGDERCGCERGWER